jgi:hypothetical protein
VDAAHGFGQRRCHGEDGQLVGALGDRHGVGADDFGDVRLTTDPAECSGREQPVRARHPDRGDATFAQFPEQFDHRAALGDLVVEHDHVAACHVTDDRGDLDPVLGEPLLGPGRDRHPEQPREVRRLLGVAQVR